jgi:hypothetical protein
MKLTNEDLDVLSRFKDKGCFIPSAETIDALIEASRLQASLDEAVEASRRYGYPSVSVAIDGPGYVARISDGNGTIMEAWRHDFEELVGSDEYMENPSPAAALRALTKAMSREVNPEQAEELKRAMEGTPECGQDFCDGCGDCLACYGGDQCYRTTPPDDAHIWVVYDAYLDEPYDYTRFF